MTEGSGIPGAVSDTKLADVTDTGVLTSAAGAASEVVMAVVPGMTMLVAHFAGTYSTATVAMEVSFNGGSTWMTLFGGSVSSGGGTTTPLSASSNAVAGWEAAIPAGVTHVRAHCTAITSGTIEVTLAQGASDYETAMAVVPSSLPSGASVIGGVFAPGTWADLTSTALEKEKSFTGAAVDLPAVATATAFSNASTGVGEYRVSATANVGGTLYLETSRDNVTWTRVKAMPLAQADTSCGFYGEIIHKPSERYCRPVFVNGVTNQTSFKVQQFKLGVA
jgi:hypothetical protein